MKKLHIIGAGLLNENQIVIEVSDGRSLSFSLDKLLTLEPDEVVTLKESKEKTS